MKIIRTLLLIGLFMPVISLQAQDEEDGKLKISGSVDTYYKYDFSGEANIGTSFADEQNSISIGMLDLIFEKSSGKSSFVGEIAFGPRNAASAGPGEDGSFAPRIQNLYFSHQLTDELTVTAGYMGTFVGYEIISPTGNFNYSTSYLFTNGPFQNAGVKFEYAISDAVSIMAGVFNPWNVYTAPSDIGPSSFGAQLALSPVEGWDAYLNFVTGGESGTEIDLTTTFQLSDDFMVGLNAASFNNGLDGDLESSFAGAAVYLNLSVSDLLALGTRYEYFSTNADFDVNAITLSANIGKGALTFIPEIRFDAASTEAFLDADGAATKTATQAVIAAVFAF
ncbi:MAG: outer membrane beta-barrel protein [Bacteroidota bacterium]